MQLNDNTPDPLVEAGESEHIRWSATIERVPDSATRILDVGCARHGNAGEDSLHAALNYHTDAEVIGIDVIADAVEDMQELGFDVRVMDAVDLEFDEPFDTVVGGEVIEHLPNPGTFLSEVESIMELEGRVILTTPNPDGFAYWRKALTGESNNQTHTCWIDPQNLHRLVEISETDLTVAERSLLPPTGGISGLLWRAGFRRAASPQYIATLDYDKS